MNKKTASLLIVVGIFAAGLLLSHAIPSALAKDPDYPTKPITFNINYAPGAAVDVAMRPLLDAVGKELGQPLVPVNKPGGAGVVAALAVMNAKPDGYTLGSCSGGNTLVTPHLDDSPYKDLSGFTFICNYGKFLLPVMVRSDAPYKTWKEFIEWCKKNQKRAAKIGVLGSRTQSPSAMVMWQAEQKEEVEFSMLVFKGSADSNTALLGGHIMMDAGGVSPQAIEYIKEGKFRVLAWLGKEKMAGYENIPSFYQMYGVIVPSVMGVWGPKGMPKYVLDKLDDAFAKGVKDPSFVNIMNRMSMPVVYMNRKDMEKEVNEMYPIAGKILKILMEKEAKEKN
jgi:tripartite-type tricarboxylate transporter receptor subunit TctC